jgi:inorganic pyrophosphatase
VPEQDRVIEVVVEVPMGSRNKYELDHERGVYVLDRMLFSAVRYPGDYGFIDDTLARDGDALDAVVILGEPTFPGCRITARVLGMLDMSDDKGPDEKILCVPDTDPRWTHIQRRRDVPEHMLDEIAHFFSIYKDLERKKVTVRGWHGLDDALATIEDSKRRFQESAHAPGATGTHDDERGV